MGLALYSVRDQARTSVPGKQPKTERVEDDGYTDFSNRVKIRVTTSACSIGLFNVSASFLRKTSVNALCSLPWQVIISSKCWMFDFFTTTLTIYFI
jgi:hypothetical protein